MTAPEKKKLISDKAVKLIKQYIIMMMAIYIGWIVMVNFLHLTRDLVVYSISSALAIPILGLLLYNIWQIKKLKKETKNQD